MSYLIEFQKQQKALRDVERDRKKNASSLLNNYRGGEHDIKEQQQLKAQKDAERDNKKNASSYLHNYRGGEHDIKDQKQQKSLKDAERNSKINASKILHGYKGGQHDIKDYERAIIDERTRGKLMHGRSSFVGQDTESSPEESDHTSEKAENPVVSTVSEKSKAAPEKDRAHEDSEHDAKHDAKQDDQQETEHDTEHDTKHDAKHDAKQDAEQDAEQNSSHSPKETKRERRGSRSEKSQARENYEKNLTNSQTDTKSSRIVSGKSRKPLSVDFSFGIILPDDEPNPGVDFCEAAASVIIPYAISQWTNETNIFCNPKSPDVIGEIDTDDWYDGDDSIRYKVKGKVPVQVFAESSTKEVEEGLKKVLKRRVSFRPILESEVEKVSAQNIIGDGDQKWMRVRDGLIGGLGITF